MTKQPVPQKRGCRASGSLRRGTSVGVISQCADISVALVPHANLTTEDAAQIARPDKAPRKYPCETNPDG